MGRILKVLGLVAGAIVALVVAITFLLAFFIDPNDYKDQIAQAVGDATGRTLTLEGNLELEVFPRLRIAVGRAELSNAAGFGAAPFAEISSARLQLQLLPLFTRRLAIDEASLEGLRLNLARNAAGTNNWQDLGGGASDSPAASDVPAGPGAELGFDVRSIEVIDAQVSWSDAGTGSEWILRDFNMSAADFGPDLAFPLEMQFGLSGAALDVVVDASMEATLALSANRYQLDELEVELRGEGEGWPGGGGVATLRFDTFTADLDAETVELNNLRMNFLGVDMAGSLTGRELLSNLSLAGAIEIAPFDPRDVLEVFDTEIETADADVFRRASARAELIYDPTQLGLRNMTLALDDSELTGSLGLRGNALRFSLAVNEINIDRYLPPAADPEAGAPPDEGDLDEVDLPIDVFRTLDAEGELRLGQTQFSGLQLSDAVFGVNARNGRVRLTPRASLYGGSINGEIRIDVRGDSADFGLVQSLANVDLMSLGRDYLNTEAVSGTGNVNLDLRATGSNMGELMRELDGDVSFTLSDGAWEGIDAWYELRRARAVASGDPAPAREGARRTPFSSVSATGVIENAVLTNRDLNASLGFMSMAGSGTVNLLTDTMDFAVTARFIDGEQLQSDPAMAGLAGASLPLTVGGTLAEPSIRPNFGALVRARAQEAVQERVEEERSEVQQRVDEQRDEARGRLRDRLKGILDR